MASGSSQVPSSIGGRLANFVENHQRELLIGAAAAVVVGGGVAYYLSSSHSGRGDEEKGFSKGGKGKKKSKGSSSKRKTVKDPDGPLLEERKTKPTIEEESEFLAVTILARMRL